MSKKVRRVIFCAVLTFCCISSPTSGKITEFFFKAQHKIPENGYGISIAYTITTSLIMGKLGLDDNGEIIYIDDDSGKKIDGNPCVVTGTVETTKYTDGKVTNSESIEITGLATGTSEDEVSYIGTKGGYLFSKHE